MAKYTTQLRSLIDAQYQIFDFDYPIFDENYRGVLEQKILDFYLFREIGFETAAQFKHFLKTRLNVIMPYYNQLYLTTNLITVNDYNINLNSVETHTRTVNTTSSGEEDTTVNGSSTSDSNTTGTNREVFSDTPNNKMGMNDYATNVTDSTAEGTNHEEGSSESTGNVTSSGTTQTIEDYEIRLTGGGGVRYNADVLMEWRKSFLNIDKQIIDELETLFMTLW